MVPEDEEDDDTDREVVGKCVRGIMCLCAGSYDEKRFDDWCLFVRRN